MRRQRVSCRLAIPALVLVGLAAAGTSARALNIVAAYDTSITNHPQASTITATIQAAINPYNSKILDNQTVNITFQRMYTGLGASSKPLRRMSYSNFINQLRLHASSTDDGIALSHLPDGPSNPVDGTDSVWVAYTLARALGLATEPQPVADHIEISVLSRAPNDRGARPEDDRSHVRQALSARLRGPAVIQAAGDGTISIYLDLCNLTTGPTPAGQYSLTAVVQHEINEVLGSSSRLNGSNNGVPAPRFIDPEDLFRYRINGARSFNTNLNDSSYFSLDGSTMLVRFNQQQGGDFSDWFSTGPHTARVQDAFATLGVDPVMNLEWRMLDALGWNYAPIGVWVDFNYGGPFHWGLYEQPFTSLAEAVPGVPTGGVIFIKGGRTSFEHPTIAKALTMTSVGGVATVGP